MENLDRIMTGLFGLFFIYVVFPYAKSWTPDYVSFLSSDKKKTEKIAELKKEMEEVGDGFVWEIRKDNKTGTERIHYQINGEWVIELPNITFTYDFADKDVLKYENFLRHLQGIKGNIEKDARPEGYTVIKP